MFCIKDQCKKNIEQSQQQKNNSKLFKKKHTKIQILAPTPRKKKIWTAPKRFFGPQTPSKKLNLEKNLDPSPTKDFDRHPPKK